MPFAQAAWNSASKAPPARTVPSWSHISGERLCITGGARAHGLVGIAEQAEHAETGRQLGHRGRSLGMDASFHGHAASPPRQGRGTRRTGVSGAQRPTAASAP